MNNTVYAPAHAKTFFSVAHIKLKHKICIAAEKRRNNRTDRSVKNSVRMRIVAQIPYNQRINNAGNENKINKKHKDKRRKNTACQHSAELNSPAAQNRHHSHGKEFRKNNAYVVHKF